MRDEAVIKRNGSTVRVIECSLHSEFLSSALARNNTNVPVDPDPFIDADECARRAGLKYVSDEDPGIIRKAWGRGFTFIDPDGEHVQDEKVRNRIDKLVIPPAWTAVWISPDPKGHLQATGRDAEGRKQYIYHPEWERIRNEMKFNRTVMFGRSLADLRKKCQGELKKEGLSREKVLAAVIILLDRTLIRIGNEAYAQRNESFGLTTLRDWHVEFSGTRCTFEFPGKRGKQHHIELDDPRLADIVRYCRDVPGHELFQYYDDGGDRRRIDSTDVNNYLKDVTGDSYSAKDFRTWGASVHAAVRLNDVEQPDDEKAADKQTVEVVKQVAEQLGNTPAVCRNYYIHPHIIVAHREGSFQDLFRRGLKRSRDGYLDAPEKALLHFFEEWQTG